jgi:hypothetical protein
LNGERVDQNSAVKAQNSFNVQTIVKQQFKFGKHLIEGQHGVRVQSNLTAVCKAFVSKSLVSSINRNLTLLTVKQIIERARLRIDHIKLALSVLIIVNRDDSSQ